MLSKRMLGILQESIRKEEEMCDFYKNTSRALKNSTLSGLFENLATEALEHKKLLELEYEAIESTGEVEEAFIEAYKKKDDSGQGENAEEKKSGEGKVSEKRFKFFSVKAEEFFKKQQSFEQELEIAKEIRANLLPIHKPEVEDLEIAYEVLMSRKVGGDYLDFHLNAKKQLFLVIGDVMGKGIPAALLMTSLRALWRNSVFQNLSPRKIVEHINAGSAEDFRANGIFATLFSACYVPMKSALWFCNAGHEPPFFIPRGKDENIPLTTPGVVVGINPDCEYQQKVQKLAPGDVILLYSDGLWEIRDPEKKGLYNKEKVAKLLIENREKSAEEILSVLISQIKTTSGLSPQRDDLTLVVIKKK